MKKVPKPKQEPMTTIHAKVPLRFAERIGQIAKAEFGTPAQVIRRAIAQWLLNHDAK